jgi:hypothetical protein
MSEPTERTPRPELVMGSLNLPRVGGRLLGLLPWTVGATGKPTRSALELRAQARIVRSRPRAHAMAAAPPGVAAIGATLECPPARP